ncbi:hypothetical protein QBC44DRAFT_366887 [Cladorrhinum sp. PSN332]|nr:hypothetical protein QBC44DRAFT_366887 [Cladorrhinum sp. PSN332]
MRVVSSLSLIVALAATAIQGSLLEDNALILARQAPGTPQFQCHSDCGSAIAGGRLPAHCDNSTWVGLYEACLSCAQSFDIWKLYGQGVGKAATACSLTASPSPSGAASAAASGSAALTTETSSAAITETPASTPATTSPPTSETESPAPAETTSTIVTSGASMRWSFESILTASILASIMFGL